MAQVTESTNVSRVAVKTVYSLLPAVAIGAGVGLVTWLLFGVLQNSVLHYVACQGNSSIIACSSRADIASAVALLLANLGGLVALTRYRVYRPLLVAIAATASMWALPKLLMDTAWYVHLAAMVLIAAALYAFFTWVNDFRRFWLAVVVAVVAVAVLRVLLTL